MKPSELIKKAMLNTGTSTAYALAKVTGVSEDSIKNYERDKVGPNGISNDVVRRLAEAAALNVLEVIAGLEMERAKDDLTRSAWGKALASLKRSSAAVLLAIAVAFAALGSVNMHSRKLSKA